MVDRARLRRSLRVADKICRRLVVRSSGGGAVLIVPKWRACLKTYKPYLAAIVVLLLTLPHWLWVVDHNFITFDYATAQLSKNMPTLFAPALYFPLRFTFGQIVNMLPVLLCLAVFFVPKHKKTKRTKTKRRRGSRLQALDVSSCHNKKVFLLTMGLIPCFVTVVLSMVLQKYVHSLWGIVLLELDGDRLLLFLEREDHTRGDCEKGSPFFCRLDASCCSDDRRFFAAAFRYEF